MSITNNREIPATDSKTFADSITNADFFSPLYAQLVKHFSDEMHKAVKGRICTPERMAKLYPIFREINAEMKEIEKEIEADEAAAPKASENSTVKSMALKLDFILNQTDITDEARDVIEAILCDNANSVGFGLGDNRLIEQSFLLLMDSLSFQYGAYLMENLQTLLDSMLFSDEIQEQLKNIHDQNRAEVSQVLNLSEVSPESLNVKLSEIHNLDNGELVAVLAQLAQNEHLPNHLLTALEAELNEQKV